MSLDEALFTLALRLQRAVWRDRAHEAALARGCAWRICGRA